MSGEEDTELRDLVAQALENNGVLAKIRAKKTFHNKPLKQFLQTTEGVIAASLVREFLEFFNLDYTLTVFDPEAYCNTEFCPSSRSELLQQLGLQEGNEKLPVLSMLLQKPSLATTENLTEVFTTPKVDDIVNGNNSSSSSSSPDLPKNENESCPREKSISPPPEPYCSRDPNNDSVPAVKDTFSLPSGPLMLDATPPSPENKSIQVENSVVNLTKAIERLDTSNNLLSGMIIEHKPLGLLPPLNAPSMSQETAKRLERIRAIMDLENYEEDFQSSVSGSQGETGEPKVAGVSVSEEIEEEVVSEGHSSASLPLEELAQDLTCDTSISLKIALPADYLEEV
ncbi:hypothetical protein B566_EDAN016561 [Ephemera danica]|nr:hypothetical protein B566_EDAN016561 [Ephemera danica]